MINNIDMPEMDSYSADNLLPVLSDEELNRPLPNRKTPSSRLDLPVLLIGLMIMLATSWVKAAVKL